MKIALFDQVVSPGSPAGSCDLRVLAALRDEHDITVFSSQLELPSNASGSVEHVPVRSLRRPALIAFLVYFVRACIVYARRADGTRFDIVQATDCGFPSADVCYAHFCHRAYLTEVWPRLRIRRSPRSLHSWMTHKAKALIEARLVRRARVIVVPAEGLARDFDRFYPGVREKIVVIRNTVDLARFERPPGFDRGSVRSQLGAGEADTVFVFVALGHFERKGLPLLLEALSTPGLDRSRLWVVGGEPGLVRSYDVLASRLGISENVTFVGRTDDVRPFLWAADAFVAPSQYEAFSLGLLEAAAAGLPLIATRISGSEELLEDAVNGIEVDRTGSGVTTALDRFMTLDAPRRHEMGSAARRSVEPLRPERFHAAWRSLYGRLEG